MEWLQAHWLDIVGAVWAFDQFLKIVSKITPWGWDDNVADYIGNFLAKFFPKSQ